MRVSLELTEQPRWRGQYHRPSGGNLDVGFCTSQLHGAGYTELFGQFYIHDLGLGRGDLVRLLSSIFLY
jgi:hypothetical protein